MTNIKIQSDLLPIASAENLGGIKIGENLSVDENGVLNAQAGGVEHLIGTQENPLDITTIPAGDYTFSGYINLPQYLYEQGGHVNPNQLIVDLFNLAVTDLQMYAEFPEEAGIHYIGTLRIFHMEMDNTAQRIVNVGYKPMGGGGDAADLYGDILSYAYVSEDVSTTPLQLIGTSVIGDLNTLRLAQSASYRQIGTVENPIDFSMLPQGPLYLGGNMANVVLPEAIYFRNTQGILSAGLNPVDTYSLYSFQNGEILRYFSDDYGESFTLEKIGALKSINNVFPDANGNITISKSTVGLGNVDNTSDANKPISTATAAALVNKEEVSNKKTSISVNTGSDVYYPTIKATEDYVAEQISNIVLPDHYKGQLESISDLPIDTSDLINGDFYYVLDMGVAHNNVPGNATWNGTTSTWDYAIDKVHAVDGVTIDLNSSSGAIEIVPVLQTKLGYVDVSGSIQTALNTKANQATTYTKTEVNTALAGKVEEAPDDGKAYAREDGEWVEISGGGISTWEEAHEYVAGDLVLYNDIFYRCTVAHTSTTTFDLTKWKTVGNVPYTTSRYYEEILTETSTVTIDFDITNIDHTEVWYNGGLLLPNEYTYSNRVLTFTEPLLPGNNIQVIFTRDGNPESQSGNDTIYQNEKALTDGNIELEDNISIYTFDTTTDATLTIDEALLSQHGKALTFELYLYIRLDSLTVTPPSNIKWINDEEPELNLLGKYLLVFKRIKGEWLGNLEHYWN